MTCTNKFRQMLLSHRTIFLFYSVKEILQFIDYPMHLLPHSHALLGPSELAAAAMYLRARLKPNSWQIAALFQVAIWTCSREIIWSIRVEVELSVSYHRELTYLRARLSRPYLSHYAPEF